MCAYPARKGIYMLRVDYESVVIQDIENFHKRDELNLNPWYQRRSVWTNSQKAYLINSIFENKPIPTCYVRHYLDVENEKSIKEVVDGQQRLRAVLSYLSDEFAAPQISGGKRIRYSALSSAERARFRMQKLSIGYLIDAGNNDVIDIFGRLNSVSKTLNDQEKRNARFSGAMKQFCLRQGSMYVDFWKDSRLFSATEISRMAEVQFASELTYNLISGLSDFSQARLDRLYLDYDEDFSAADSVAKRFDTVMRLMLAVEEDIGSSIFSRTPIFFSLFLALDDKKHPIKKVRSVMADIDQIYNEIDENGASDADEADVDFYNACVASTQRIKSRRTRHDYIAALLKA
jgi:hypothetical protein